MIAAGLFGAQLNTIGNILRELKLFEERQPFPTKDLGAAHFKGMGYRQVYEEMVRQYAYDFRLADQSLLLFIKAGNNAEDGLLSYSFIECPVQVATYRSFVAAEAGIEEADPNSETRIEEWGDELRPDYEQYVNSLNAKHVVTPIRYDYKASDYKPGRHPASHVHFGLANDIRVGTERIMRPMSFVLFVLRQRYPDAWEELRPNANIANYCRNIRDELDRVDDAYWNELDEHELMLK